MTEDMIADQDARIEQLRLANNRLYRNWLREKERNEQLEAAIDTAIGGLQTLAFSDQLRAESTAIGGVVRMLLDAVEDEG